MHRIIMTSLNTSDDIGVNICEDENILKVENLPFYVFYVMTD